MPGRLPTRGAKASARRCVLPARSMSRGSRRSGFAVITNSGPSRRSPANITYVARSSSSCARCMSSSGVVSAVARSAAALSKDPASRCAELAPRRRCARSGRVVGERNRPLEECWPPPRASPRERSLCAPFECVRYPFVGSWRAEGLVPRSPIGVEGGIGCFGQGPVCSLTVLGSGGAIGRRAHQRVREPDCGADFNEPVLDGRCRVAWFDTERSCGVPDDDGITDRIRGPRP